MECCGCNLLMWMVVFVAIIFTYFKWSFQYWKRRNIHGPVPSFPFGNAQNPMRMTKHLSELLSDLYFEYKSKGEKHVGFYLFSKPMYNVIDLEIAKLILTKDFNHFMDRGIYYNEKDDPLSAHLFSLDGVKWKNLRAKLTPTFTSGKMRNMFSTLVEVGKQMEEAVKSMSESRQSLDIKDVLARFTTDIIGSCAFGIDCNSFKEPDSKFRKNGIRVFQNTTMQNLRHFIAFAFPELGRTLGIKMIDPEASEFFMGVIKNTVQYREGGKVTRKDFIQLLMELRNTDHNSLTFEEMAAQAFVFFLAGFETSSTTMTYCLFELSKHPEIQQKVHEEINAVLKKHQGQLTYEAVAEMILLERCINETLRMYPPINMLSRRCTKAYNVPGTNFTLEQNTNVFIPVSAIHNDPEYYPEPKKFDPDRFSEKAKADRHPFSFMPFGDGPRNCIGMRFGLMQSKVGLCAILKNFKLKLNENTLLPLQINPYSFITSTKQTIWLDSELIK